MTSLHALQRYTRPAPRVADEVCEICAADLGAGHRHVVDLDRRALCCACGACATLFVDPGAGAGRYRTVPDRVRHDPTFQLSDAEWAELGVPVRLAFLLFSSRVARWFVLYPGPAGVAEAEIEAEAVARLAARLPIVASVEQDVEALLVYGRRGEPLSALLVPVTACYELVGRMRRSWKGIDGGDDARREVDGAWEQLRARSRPIRARREAAR